jgi:hypothetical protein
VIVMEERKRKMMGNGREKGMRRLRMQMREIE